MGLIQVAVAFTQDSPLWMLFYVLFGATLALVGAAFLWADVRDDDA